MAAIIVQREIELQKKVYESNRDDIEDKIWRSYGILKTARKISGKEAMQLISNLMEGRSMGIEKLPKCSIGFVELMINIQPAGLQLLNNREMLPSERDKYRAEYIRKTFE